MGLRFLITALFALFLSSLAAPAWSAHPPAEHDAPQEQSEETSSEDTSQEEISQTGETPPASGQEHPYDATQGSEGHAHDGEDPCAEDDHHDGTAGAPATGHAHWGEDGVSTPFERAMSRLGVFHAVGVHFPIALILAAALAQILVLAGRFANGAETVRFLVWTGALGGVVAGLLGWAHSGPMGANEAGVMLYHRMIGSALMFVLVVLIGLSEWNRRSPSTPAGITFNATLFGSATALLLNAFLGGALAHGGLRHLFGGG